VTLKTDLVGVLFGGRIDKNNERKQQENHNHLIVMTVERLFLLFTKK